jgi:hypothetical protein
MAALGFTRSGSALFKEVADQPQSADWPRLMQPVGAWPIAGGRAPGFRCLQPVRERVVPAAGPWTVVAAF